MPPKRRSEDSDADHTPNVSTKRQKGDDANVQRPTIPKDHVVRAPVKLGSPAAKPNNRSASTQKRSSVRSVRHRLHHFLKDAPRYVADVTYEQLKEDARHKEDTLRKLQQKCDKKMSKLPATPFSRLYVDPNGRILAAYLAYRLASQKRTGDTPVAQQYTGQTRADLDAAIAAGQEIYFDGIPQELLAEHQRLTQWLLSRDQPVVPARDIRHDEDRSKLETYVHSYQDAATGETLHERRGVHHLVHAWTAQGHPHGPLTPSSDMLGGHSATGAVAARTYFCATSKVARMLGEMFKAVFPKEYERYKKAFDAGVWFREDPGPWIARAIVYKLDVSLHFDGLDGGPTATFPVGQYTGGAMELPQLNAKLEYGPGTVLLSLSGFLAHRVTEWKTADCDLEESHGCAPGRIGNVFFFPKNSLRRLKGKPAGWGIMTAYGELDALT